MTVRRNDSFAIGFSKRRMVPRLFTVPNDRSFGRTEFPHFGTRRRENELAEFWPVSDKALAVGSLHLFTTSHSVLCLGHIDHHLFQVLIGINKLDVSALGPDFPHFGTRRRENELAEFWPVSDKALAVGSLHLFTTSNSVLCLGHIDHHLFQVLIGINKLDVSALGPDFPHFGTRRRENELAEFWPVSDKALAVGSLHLFTTSNSVLCLGHIDHHLFQVLIGINKLDVSALGPDFPHFGTRRRENELAEFWPVSDKALAVGSLHLFTTSNSVLCLGHIDHHLFQVLIGINKLNVSALGPDFPHFGTRRRENELAETGASRRFVASIYHVQFGPVPRSHRSPPVQVLIGINKLDVSALGPDFLVRYRLVATT